MGPPGHLLHVPSLRSKRLEQPSSLDWHEVPGLPAVVDWHEVEAPVPPESPATEPYGGVGQNDGSFESAVLDPYPCGVDPNSV